MGNNRLHENVPQGDVAVVHIYRTPGGDQGTLGFLVTEGFSCFTLELPWRDNRGNVSRIPSGAYECVWARSAKYGWKYLVKDVPGRTWIRAHRGNYAGDKSMGYKTHSAGCILLGKSWGALQDQLAILNSATTIRRFEEHMRHQPFTLRIIGGN